MNLWYFIKGMFFLLRFIYEIFVINIVTRLEVIYVCNLDTSTNARLKEVAMLRLQHVSSYDWPSIFLRMCLSIMNVRISIYSSANGVIGCGLNNVRCMSLSSSAPFIHFAPNTCTPTFHLPQIDFQIQPDFMFSLFSSSIFFFYVTQ